MIFTLPVSGMSTTSTRVGVLLLLICGMEWILLLCTCMKTMNKKSTYPVHGFSEAGDICG